MKQKIKLNQDAFGQEILAYFKGKRSFEIIERDDGWFGAAGGAPIYFSTYKHWQNHYKKAIKLARGRILDIGCGAGRHSLYLQKKGFDVTGIDNSPLAIKVCKARGLKKAKVMSISDVGEFKTNSFDTILMLGNNFGLFGSPKRAKVLLKKLYKITSPKALIIVESRDLYKTDDPDHLAYHKLNRQKGRMAGQLKFRIRFGKYIGLWFDYLIVSKTEMKMILKRTGWKAKRFIDDKDGIYIAIIEKVPPKN